MYHNSLIIFDVFPIQKVFPTWRIIPKVLNDPHVVNPLPAVTPRTGAEKKQQTSRKQPQSPCHVRVMSPLDAGRSVSRVLVQEEQVETATGSMWARTRTVRWCCSTYETLQKKTVGLFSQRAATGWPPPAVQPFDQTSQCSRVTIRCFWTGRLMSLPAYGKVWVVRFVFHILIKVLMVSSPLDYKNHHGLPGCEKSGIFYWLLYLVTIKSYIQKLVWGA